MEALFSVDLIHHQSAVKAAVGKGLFPGGSQADILYMPPFSEIDAGP